MKFNPKHSPLYPALLYRALFSAVKTVKKITGLLSLLSLIGIYYNFLVSSKPFPRNIFFFSTALFIVSFVLDRFYETKLKRAQPETSIDNALQSREEVNLASFFELDVLDCLFAKDTYALLGCLIQKSQQARFITDRLLIDRNNLKKLLRKAKKEQRSDLSDLIIKSLESARDRGREKAGAGDLLFVLSQQNSVFKKIMMDRDLYSEDIINLAWWYEQVSEEEEKRKKWWEYENLLQKGSLGRLWSTSYTVVLDKFSTDLTYLMQNEGAVKIIGQEKVMGRIERELAGADTNKVLLVGEPGCGRTALIHAVVSRIAFGRSQPEINYKRAVQINMTGLLSQTKTNEEAYFLLEKIFKEIVAAKNIILVIDDFHNFITSQEKGGIFDLTGVLAKYLESPYFRLLAATDTANYQDKVEPKAGLLYFLEKIDVKGLSEKETILAMEKRVPFYETNHDLYISYPALREMIEYSKYYISDYVFPKKAMHVLEDVVTYVQTQKEKVVLPKHVDKIVEEKIKVPVGKMEQEEKETLLNLESLIHQKIINQEEAVREVSEALRRARSGVATKKGPIGGFLFMGPTGVGKTETAKVLAEIYFGSRDNMIRLDMSEYQSKEDIKRIIGTKEQQGVLSGAVRKNPFSLILLDEIEKAHPDLLHLFLQVLDEGYFTDGVGRRIGFGSSIIIATSNAGYKIILKGLEQSTPHTEIRKTILSYVFDHNIFRPEFINRFDAVVVFHALSKSNLLDIAGLMLQKVQKNMKKKYIDFVVTNELKQKIVELSYDPKFGAREMQRVIQDTVEDALAEALLDGTLEKGDRIQITPQFKIIKI